ncbi:MAG: lipocalin family protein [Bacteroidales bacterium]|nr:lipocalin family protein [Bacteroidales bacterium]
MSKKLQLTLVLIGCTILLGSCTFKQRSTIVGVWQITSYHDIEYQNGHVMSDNKSAPLDPTTIVFSRNGVMQMHQQGSGFNYSMTGTWRLHGQQLTIVDNQHQMVCNAMVNGTTLVMSYAVEQKANGVTYRYITEMAARKTR